MPHVCWRMLTYVQRMLTYVQRRTMIQAAEGDLDAAGMLTYADVC